VLKLIRTLGLFVILLVAISSLPASASSGVFLSCPLSCPAVIGNNLCTDKENCPKEEPEPCPFKDPKHECAGCNYIVACGHDQEPPGGCPTGEIGWACVKTGPA
jgi:hypothetical protein